MWFGIPMSIIILHTHTHTQKTHKISRRKEIIKNQAKINERKNSKDNKTKGSFFKKIKKKANL